jgi:hypothetical protein
MNYFNDENTIGYTDDQLNEMNKLFSEMLERERAAWPDLCQKSLSDRFLTEYENKLAQTSNLATKLKL